MAVYEEGAGSAVMGGAGNAPRRVYLDHAAATPADGRVVRAMEPYWRTVAANPASLHREGCAAHDALERARRTVAGVLGATPDEIVFTSGGTEGNNLAIMGAVRAYRSGVGGEASVRPQVVFGGIEHSSVRACRDALTEAGVEVRVVPVDGTGRVRLDLLRAALTPDTLLVSLQYVNNEVGTIEPLREVGKAVRAQRRGGIYPLFHSDASQAPAWLPCRVHTLGVDLLTLDGQKVYGPKGVGCLYRARDVPLAPLSYGGGQEFGMRPGTPPVPLIVGFAEALMIAEAERAVHTPRITALRDHVAATLRERVPECAVNGEGAERVAHILNVSFPGVDAERLVIELDARGVAAATKSACLVGGEGSHSYVVKAMSDRERAASAVRFSLGRGTSEEDVAYALAAIVEAVAWLGGEG